MRFAHECQCNRRGNAAHWCARAWSWLILATTGVAVTVEGLEQLTPGATYMFVSNHQSIYDTPVVFSSLPYQLRIIAKQSLAKFPVLGWHLKRSRHLFVDRSQPDRAGILNRSRALVSEGASQRRQQICRRLRLRVGVRTGAEPATCE